MSNLIRYDAACQALAECKAVDEVKEWADKAAAMQAYGRMAKDKTLEVDAAEIRIRAERRLGEMIGAQKADGGLNKGGRPVAEKTGSSEEPVSGAEQSAPTLADAGIDKKLSARAQKLAAVPEAEFEAEVAGWRDRVEQEGERVTARLERAGERAQGKPKLTVIEGGKDAARVAELEAEVASLREQIAELTKNLEETLADNASMAKVFDANDQLADAVKQMLQRDALIRTLNERIGGFQNERNEHIRLIKAWRKKAEARTA